MKKYFLLATMLLGSHVVTVRALTKGWQQDTIQKLKMESNGDLRNLFIKKVVCRACNIRNLDDINNVGESTWTDFFSVAAGRESCNTILQEVRDVYNYNQQDYFAERLMNAPVSPAKKAAAEYAMNSGAPKVTVLNPFSADANVYTMTLEEAEMNNKVREWHSIHNIALPVKYMTRSEAEMNNKLDEWEMNNTAGFYKTPIK